MQIYDIEAARRGRWAVAAMFVTNGFIWGSWAPQIPLLLPRHQISETTLGLLILGLGIGAVGAMFFSGRLISIYGSRRIVLGFACAVLPVLPLIVFAPNLWLLAPAMALLGALAGSMDVAMNANAVEVERQLGRAIMSSSHGFWSLGGFIGGFIGSFVIAYWGSGVQALAVSLISAAVIALAARHLVADAPHPATAAAPAAPHVLFPRDLGLWILGFMALFSMVPEGAILDWAAIYLNQEMGADLFRSGLAFAFFAGTMAVMRFAGDSIRNRFGAVRTLRVSGLISAVAMLGAAAAPNDVIAIVCFSACGIGIANMIPILFSAAGNYPGIASGSAMSTVTTVGYAGILVAPSTIGFAADHVGFRATYAVLALLLLVVVTLAGRAATADGVKTP